MRRGDIVTVAPPGEFGKPRPAVIIQSDALNRASPDSTILALMTSHLVDAPLLRLTIEPNESNGLKTTSQVRSHRLITVRKKRIGETIGRLAERELVELNRLLALAIGLA